jgi:hypothetical protein
LAGPILIVLSRDEDASVVGARVAQYPPLVEPVTGVSDATFTLRTAAGAIVPSVVSYNPSTRVATLNPKADLPTDSQYTVTLTGALRVNQASSIQPVSGSHQLYGSSRLDRNRR